MKDNKTIDEIISDFKCHDKGLILPLINEYTWPLGARIFIYFFGLIWSFLGVSIIADRFMGAIEMITSKTRKIRIPDENGEKKEIEVPVWNNTVANLTLMALGSSAPEILLACIEICFNKFEAGDLGPGTIVGSGAFNLLCIVAVCVVSIPEGEVRRISSFKVFGITAFSSIFSYVWLIIILKGISPNKVELWEALITFLFFPILVLSAYAVDKQCFGRCTRTEPEMTTEKTIGFKLSSFQDDDHLLKDSERDRSDNPERRLSKYIKTLRMENTELTEEELEEMARLKLEEEHKNKPRNYLYYRIGGVRSMAGGKRIFPKWNSKFSKIVKMALTKTEKVSVSLDHVDAIEWPEKAVVEFEAVKSSVLEKAEFIEIPLRRTGNLNIPAIVQVETADGSAKVSDDDYEPLHKIVVFRANEVERKIKVKIIDDDQYEGDEIFFVKLHIDDAYSLYRVIHKENIDTSEIEDFLGFDCKSLTTEEFCDQVSEKVDFSLIALGDQKIHEVTIEDDDNPGTFAFKRHCEIVTENTLAKIPVIRSEGSDGLIIINWSAKGGNATPDKDYYPTSGSIEFKHGEVEKNIEITIVNDDDKEDENFQIFLDEENAGPGVKFGKITSTWITIVSDDDMRGIVSKLLNNVKHDLLDIQLEKTTWREQFVSAFSVTDGDVSEATVLDFIMHFLSFPWKVLFAFVPPPSYLGGWLAFFAALFMIAIVTAIVGDLATIAGCLSGLKPSVTAITFVALGTSLPDLFASKQAACSETTADNSIGNVTGSNSVNVFLGLGLPWLIASIYHTSKDRTFEVKAGTLSFSVVLYTISAILCISLLIIRRYLPSFGDGKRGGELGGNVKLKWCTAIFMVLLWLSYILLSALQAYDHIPGF